MVQASPAVEIIKQQAEDALEQVAAHPWFERLARFGYATKGVVYMVVGALATLAAVGIGVETTDTRGALQAIAMRPFGKILLGIVAIGLVGYVLWRWVQAVADVDDKGNSFKGLMVRAGYGLSGLAYAALALSAAQIILEARDAARGDRPEDWTASLMALPYGDLLIGLIGAGVIIFGIFQIHKGYRAKFRKRLKLAEMSRTEEPWATLSGRIGYAARGVVFCIVGVFLIQAARHHNSNEIVGLDGALRKLAEQNFGPWILGIVAAGLVAYGIYMLVESRYRRINGS
ncbi:MAG TPA: DUF1206 domain-containing protein [Pyrinomonadaceae bacterium]|nr:DUF1206 domain-containing protein [Pyrinomonadaceae bacterium]